MSNDRANEHILYILDRNFVQFYAISDFNSLIWTERYWECGDFELEMFFDLEILDKVKVGYYIALGKSPNIMVIESIDITYEIDNKAARYIVYKGRTMESILDRRIMWGEWLYEETDAQSIIFDLIDKSIVNPEDDGRKIEWFRMRKVDGLLEYLLTLYGDGDNVYEIVRSICQEKQMGMKAEFIENERAIEFSLYSGKDHSYDQTRIPPVIFSSTFGNLGPSRYSLNTTGFKTVALVTGPWRDTNIFDEEGNVIDTETTRSMIEVGDFSVTGIDRREMLVEAGSGYPEDMARQAMEEIAEINRLEELDSELDPRRQFVYGVDYTIGDIVQVITDFGLDSKAIVVEFIRSWDENGYNEVPTFKLITKDMELNIITREEEDA